MIRSGSVRRSVHGTHRVPGDKSITHRALLLAALADGASRIRGALASDDAQSTASVLRGLGVAISPLDPGAEVTVIGQGGLSAPAEELDCGNSGTTARLVLGVLAAHRFSATLTGDASLQRRPMRRVTDPLAQMGAHIVAPLRDGLPLTITGGGLQPLEWRLPVASAQIKSALLLAGAVAGVDITLHQCAVTRDHTERMLRRFGFTIEEQGLDLMLRPTGRLQPFDIDVPGDPSSAIFLLAAAALASHGDVEIDGIGLNPTRIGFVDVLRRMGVDVGVSPREDALGEPVGTLSAGTTRLRAVTVPASEAPAVIDEIPMLACLAARAAGVSRFEGLAELRVKESDRLSMLATNLRRVGVDATVEGDTLVVPGTPGVLSGEVRTDGDHRIAMAFMVLGTSPDARIEVDDPGCASVSFPGFVGTLRGVFAP